MRMTHFAIPLLFAMACAHLSAPETKSIGRLTAEDILERHIVAIGGRAARGAVKTVETKSEVEIFGSTRKSLTIQDRSTGRIYSRSEDPTGVIEQGYDGKNAWRKAPFFKGILPDSDPSTKAFTRKPKELFRYREDGRTFKRLPDQKIDGADLLVLQTTDHDPLGREIQEKYYFDPQTFLLKRTVKGSELSQTTTYDDYRQVDGLTEAFRTTTHTSQLSTVTTVVSIAHNVPVEDSIFEFGETRPESAEAGKPTPPISVGEPSSAGAKQINESTRLEALDLVWNTVNDTYFDPSFGGVDWMSIRQKYVPRVKATSDLDAFHDLLNEMLAELNRSHLRVLRPSKTYGLHTKSDQLKNASVGIELRWIDGQLVVTRAHQGSPAAREGLKPGYAITRVNGKTPDELFVAYQQAHKSETREPLNRVRAVQEELSGLPNTSATVEAENERGEKRQFSLARQKQPEEPEFSARRIEPRIGYIRFDRFFGDILNQFKAAVARMQDTDGLIIDVRGNPGGAGDLASALASALSSQDGSLGTSKMRYGQREFSFKGSGATAYPGRVVMLVDEMSGSSAEVFAGGLQDFGRVTVVGQTTAGAVLPSLMTVLPTGGAFLHAISDFRTSKGTALEGRGVIPDILAKPSRQSLLAGRDNALERAIEFLKDPSADRNLAQTKRERIPNAVGGTASPR